MAHTKQLTRFGPLTDPFAFVRQLTTELDRFAADPRWPTFGFGGTAEATTWWPRVDVVRKENTLFARVDLPGVKKGDVRVEVIDGRLTISGERKREFEETKENVYRCERETGTFFRAIPLPDGVAEDKIKATFADGVLEVVVPLPPAREAGARRIDVEEGVKAA